MIASLLLVALAHQPLASGEVDVVNRGYVHALVQRDVRAAVSPYAADIVFISKNNRVIRGKAALEAMLAQRLTTTTFAGGSCTTDTLRSTGEQAWETGHCSFLVRTHSGTRATSGRYMAYWKRQAEGAWKIEVNVAE